MDHAASGECLDAAQLAAFAAGRLDASVLLRVDAHLDGCARCLDAVAASATASRRVLGAGDRVGRYTLQERLGSGALGVVHAATDETLRRRVALKLLRTDRLDADGLDRRRMLREARVLARLEHPNVVPVYDAGEVGGVGYVAMRLVEGTTLRRWCRGAGWPAIVERYLDAAAGLIAAHDAGLVHRDFKPDNVLVEHGGTVYVCDFGLAGFSGTSAARSRGSVDDGLTSTGATPGTPLYMAPELWRGEAASPASDQFAFCVALWESVVGQPPFVARTREQLQLRLHEALDESPLRDAGMPRGLVRVVLRGLAADPADRHRSMRALVRAVRGRTRMLRVGAAARVVAPALAVAAWMLAVPAVTNPDRCVVDADSRSAALQRADLPVAAATRVTEALEDYRTRFVAAEVEVCHAAAGGATEAATRCLDGRLVAFDRLGQALRELPATTVRTHGLAAVASLPPPEACPTAAATISSWPGDTELRARLGDAVLVAERVTPLLDVGDLDAARADLDAVLPQLEAEAPSSYLLAARVRRLAIDETSGQPIAAGAYAPLIDLATEHQDLAAAANLWARRLGSAANRGDLDDLPALLDTARWAFELAGRPAAHAASFHEAQGFAAFRLGRWGSAREHLQHAIAAMVDEGRPSHPKVAELRGAVAMLAYRQGRVEEALAITTRAWDQLAPVVDPGFPALARIASNLATYHDELGARDETMRWARVGLGVLEHGAVADPVLRTVLVEALVTRDALPQARQDADALVQWSAGRDPYVQGRARRIAARVAFRADDFTSMRAHLDAAQRAFETAGAAGELAGTRYDRARLLRGEGDLEAAAALFDDIIEHDEAITGMDVAGRVQLRIEAAELALERHRPADARRLVDAAREALPEPVSPTLASRVAAVDAQLAGEENDDRGGARDDGVVLGSRGSGAAHGGPPPISAAPAGAP